MLVSWFSSASSLRRSTTANDYFAATATVSSLAALVGLAAGGTGSLAAVEDGAGAAGLSMLDSVVTGAAPVRLSQRCKCT